MIQYYEHTGDHAADGHGSLPPSDPYNQQVAMHQGDDPEIYAERIFDQLRDLAHNSREIWMAISGLQSIPGNIRVHVVIHHAVKRYESRLSESPPLAMFIDGLSNEKGMRPVRNVNNLVCKFCYLHPGQGNAIGEAKTFSLPQLVGHFQQHRIESCQAMNTPLPDWTVDMILVSDLTNLARLHGIDAHQYSLIMQAFPDIPMPDAQSHHVTSTSDVQSGASMHGDILSKGRVVHTRPGESLEKRSSDAKQESVKTVRGQMTGLKDKRTTPGQRWPQFKGVLKTGGNSSSSRGPSIGSKEDNEGDVEEQRQEQAIRAMWAAERRDAARVVVPGPASPRLLAPQPLRDPSAVTRSAGNVEKLLLSTLVLGARIAPGTWLVTCRRRRWLKLKMIYLPGWSYTLTSIRCGPLVAQVPSLASVSPPCPNPDTNSLSTMGALYSSNAREPSRFGRCPSRERQRPSSTPPARTQFTTGNETPPFSRKVPATRGLLVR